MVRVNETEDDVTYVICKTPYILPSVKPGEVNKNLIYMTKKEFMNNEYNMSFVN